MEKWLKIRVSLTRPYFQEAKFSLFFDLDYIIKDGNEKLNNDSKALDTLVSEMIKGVKSYCKKLDFDRTYTGIISSVNKDGYTVKYNGTEINIKTTATDVLKKGDMVKFCVPCGNKSKAYFVVDLGLMKRYVDKRIAELKI